MATELEKELERTTAIRGFRYGLHEFVAAVGGVEALKSHNEEVNYGKPEGLLDVKTKELLRIVAQCANGGPQALIQCHMHAAHKAGASPEEILEALNLVRSSIGTRGQFGLEAWRATFRPDLPTILRVVELR
jgi:4-carboxymuconolactone decarboxylase